MGKRQTKTRPTSVDPRDFIETVEHPVRKSDALVLLDLFARVSGFEPKMWDPSIIGFGRYQYRYETGREDDFLATGFSPRKSNMSIHILPGYQDYSAILARLGKHKMGKSCLYVNKLKDIDLDVLEELIRLGLSDLQGIWPVYPE